LYAHATRTTNVGSVAEFHLLSPRASIAKLREFADRRRRRYTIGHANQRVLRAMAHKIEVALGASGNKSAMVVFVGFSWLPEEDSRPGPFTCSQAAD